MAKLKTSDSRQSVDLKWKLRKQLEDVFENKGGVASKNETASLIEGPYDVEDPVSDNKALSFPGGFTSTAEISLWGPVLEVTGTEGGSSDSIGMSVLYENYVPSDFNIWQSGKNYEDGNGLSISIGTHGLYVNYYENFDLKSSFKAMERSSWTKLSASSEVGNVLTFKGRNLTGEYTSLMVVAKGNSSSAQSYCFVTGLIKEGFGGYSNESVQVVRMAYGTTSDDVADVRITTISKSNDDETIEVDMDNCQFPSGYTITAYLRK